MRFVLVALSGIVAGYVAWGALKDENQLVDPAPEKTSKEEKMPGGCASWFRAITALIVDYGSGAYLWRHYQSSKSGPTLKVD